MSMILAPLAGYSLRNGVPLAMMVMIRGAASLAPTPLTAATLALYRTLGVRSQISSVVISALAVSSCVNNESFVSGNRETV